MTMRLFPRCASAIVALAIYFCQRVLFVSLKPQKQQKPPRTGGILNYANRAGVAQVPREWAVRRR